MQILKPLYRKQAVLFMSHFEDRGKRPAGQALQTFVLILSLLSTTESVAVLFSSTLSNVYPQY